MKANITRASDRYSGPTEERTFDTLEQLRDFILSTGHSVIISVPEKVQFAASGGVDSVEVIPDTLNIEIYDSHIE
jgi:hypothetical protein